VEPLRSAAFAEKAVACVVRCRGRFAPVTAYSAPNAPVLAVFGHEHRGVADLPPKLRYSSHGNAAGRIVLRVL